MKIGGRFAVLSVVVLIAAGAVSPVHAKLAPGKRFIVVLRRGSGDPGQVAAEHARAYGAEVTKVYHTAIDGYAATIPSNRVASLRADPDVLFLTPDGQVSATDQTTSTGVERIHAGSTGDKANGVNVAVIDTGIDLRHPDLAANIVGGRTAPRADRRATATRTVTAPTSPASSRRRTTGSGWSGSRLQRSCGRCACSIRAAQAPIPT